jgi:STE24 endopeptidase
MNYKQKVLLRTFLLYLFGSFCIYLASIFYARLGALWATAFIFLIVFGFVYMVSQIFEIFFGAKKYTGKYRSKFLQIAKSKGINLKEIYFKKGEAPNANALSFGNNKAVIFNTHLLEKYSYPELEAVMMHELGHHKDRDAIFESAAVLLILAFSGWSNRLVSVEVALIYALLLLPFVLYLSRWREGLADQYAYKNLKNPKNFAKFLERSLKIMEKDGNKIPRNSVYKSLYSHPWIYDRIAYFRAIW